MNAGSPRLIPVVQEQLTSDDYYTPAWVFERMGIEFDIDVCAPPGGVPWIPAAHHYTQEDNGLTQPWNGNVWMNPPYSNVTPWVNKFMIYGLHGGGGACVVPQAKAQWHIRLWERADAIVVPDVRLTFIGGPSDGDIRFAVMFAAFGNECVDAISRLGVVRSIPPTNQ